LRVKKIFWVASGLCAAAAGFLAWGTRHSEPVEDLSHRADEPVPVEAMTDDGIPEEVV
jgi:hypothetical protein